jgi:type II secretory pathway component GspD/PulD (secretin)
MHFMGNDTKLQLSGLANPLAGQAFFINVDGANLEALVECLKTTTDAKTLASPKVLVLNGQQARIQIGEQLGYKVITTTETASMEDVKFLEVGVVLTVTPHISRDNQVVMRVRPKVSSGGINPDTALPEEKTTEVETDVLLRNGQGMVIGGLIQEKDSNVQSKIPVLGDIWLIGRLFQRREIVKRRSEIIITLIPRVLPYLPEYEAQDQLETFRAATPLLHGPLCRYPRPWEPSLPDTDCRLHGPRCR